MRSIPASRLSSFYFVYYAALGAFTPYWSLFLKSRGQDVAAIGVLMSLWYATRIVAPSTWSGLAARSRHPVRWLRGGCVLTLAGAALFVLPLDFAGLFTIHQAVQTGARSGVEQHRTSGHDAAAAAAGDRDRH